MAGFVRPNPRLRRRLGCPHPLRRSSVTPASLNLMPSRPPDRNPGARSTRPARGMRPTSSSGCWPRPRRPGASDVHFQPGADGLELRWRIDGVLQPVAMLPAKVAPNVVARLKVLAELLTYRTDVPQEGRIRGVAGRGRDAAQHLPDRLRREGRGPDVRGARAVPPARRPRPARRGPRRPLARARRDLGRDHPGRSGGQRQDDHDLRLPARAGGAPARRAQPGDARRPDRVDRPGRLAVPGQPGRRADARDRA